MTRRRDFPPTPPSLPKPVLAPQRDPDPATGAIVAAEQPRPNLVDGLRAAAERGTAGTLCLDWEHAGSLLPSLVSEFTSTGFFQREGRGPAAVAIVVGRAGRRIIIEVMQPGRRSEPLAFEPALGTEADISNPAVLARIRTEIDQLRQVPNPLPMLVLLDPTVVPAEFGRDHKLQKQVKDLVEPGIYISVIRDTPGFQPAWQEGSPAAMFPMLGAEPAGEDVTR